MTLPHMKKPCKDCPFRRDCMRGWLGADRMSEILNSGSFVCHKKNDFQCAGHMLINGMDNDFVKLASRLGINLNLAGQQLIFATKLECIEHHK